MELHFPLGSPYNKYNNFSVRGCLVNRKKWLIQLVQSYVFRVLGTVEFCLKARSVFKRQPLSAKNCI
jgi:hypothetical protein